MTDKHSAQPMQEVWRVGTKVIYKGRPGTLIAWVGTVQYVDDTGASKIGHVIDGDIELLPATDVNILPMQRQKDGTGGGEDRGG